MAICSMSVAVAQSRLAKVKPAAEAANNDRGDGSNEAERSRQQRLGDVRRDREKNSAGDSRACDCVLRGALHLLRCSIRNVTSTA